MINLLPPVAWEQVRREYRRRWWVVLGLVVLSVSLASLVVTWSLFFFIFSSRLATARTEAAGEQSGEVVAARERATAWAAFRRQAGMAIDPDAPHVGPVVERILAARGTGVMLANFYYEDHGSTDPVLARLAGQAATRRDLLGFIDRLKADPMFAEVESPVGNLIKDRAVDFTLTLTIASHE